MEASWCKLKFDLDLEFYFKLYFHLQLLEFEIGESGRGSKFELILLLTPLLASTSKSLLRVLEHTQ